MYVYMVYPQHLHWHTKDLELYGVCEGRTLFTLPHWSVPSIVQYLLAHMWMESIVGNGKKQLTQANMTLPAVSRSIMDVFSLFVFDLHQKTYVKRLNIFINKYAFYFYQFDNPFAWLKHRLLGERPISAIAVLGRLASETQVGRV